MSATFFSVPLAAKESGGWCCSGSSDRASSGRLRWRTTSTTVDGYRPSAFNGLEIAATVIITTFNIDGLLSAIEAFASAGPPVLKRLDMFFVRGLGCGAIWTLDNFGRWERIRAKKQTKVTNGLIRRQRAFGPRSGGLCDSVLSISSGKILSKYLDCADEPLQPALCDVTQDPMTDNVTLNLRCSGHRAASLSSSSPLPVDRTVCAKKPMGRAAADVDVDLVTCAELDALPPTAAVTLPPPFSALPTRVFCKATLMVNIRSAAKPVLKKFEEGGVMGGMRRMKMGNVR
ncbi:hypothetical protein FB45DRAFT_1067200 [Roridomyces roridus]|uniref:Uncharacterized protein n=1 Tax=Roridomyces roridus TaxID=1738132 RepID=A0AAD7B388_9AGAR|nr:hypothetical protein FB45DRAFT_1067200 [Roridomyces roridus]